MFSVLLRWLRGGRRDVRPGADVHRGAVPTPSGKSWTSEQIGGRRAGDGSRTRVKPPVIKGRAKRGEAAHAALASGPRVTIDFDFVRDVRGKRQREMPPRGQPLVTQTERDWHIRWHSSTHSLDTVWTCTQGDMRTLRRPALAVAIRTSMAS